MEIELLECQIISISIVGALILLDRYSIFVSQIVKDGHLDLRIHWFVLLIVQFDGCYRVVDE